MVLACSIIINIAFQYENLYFMASSRFLQGVVARMISISNYWWIQQTSLPSQKSRLTSMPLLFYSCANIIMYIISLNDDEGPSYWRGVALMPVGVGTLALLLDLIFVRRMDSVKFAVIKEGVDAAKKRAYLIYEKQTADLMCEDFDKVNQDLRAIGKNGESFSSQVKVNKRQLIHITIVTMMITFSCYTLYESYFVYITTFNLSDLPEVELSKKWALLAVISETFGYIINSAMDFGKNPKKLLISCFWLTTVSAGLVAFGYFKQDLRWSRFSSISNGISLAAIWGAFNPYYLSILPTVLCGVPPIIFNFINAVLNQTFPLILNSEAPNSSWATFFTGLAGFAFLMWLLLAIIVKPTAGLMDSEI